MNRHSLLALLLVLGHTLHAQVATSPYHRQYATQRYMKNLIADHPEIVEARSAIEQQTFGFLQYGQPDTPSIQVVFHLIGSAASGITATDVQAQLDALNRDFFLPAFTENETAHPAWTAEGFVERAAMPSIRFCLAQEDPTGSPTTGALYISSTVEGFPVGAAISNPLMGGSMAWDPHRYLNIWVAALEGEIAGYAQMPGGPKGSDGIVLNAKLFARADVPSFLAAQPQMANYVQGRTLSHLVGSYLNLYELWNDDRPCADDYVEDTPIHNAPNFNKPAHVHVSTCNDNPVEMTMNLMDNTDDEVQYMFTNGQMMWMYACLAVDGGARNGLREHNGGCGSLNADQHDWTGERDGNSTASDGRKNMVVSVYPNPTSNGLTVLIDAPCADLITIKVASQLCVEQFAQTIEGAIVGNTNAVYIRTDDWAPGIYVLQVKCGNETASKKVLLER